MLRTIDRFVKALESMRKAANASSTVEVEQLERSQFPDEVRKADGYVLRRPGTWR